jgi:type IV pilus assembly protein PilY1
MPLHVTSVTRITMNTKYLMAGSIILFALLTVRRSDAQAVFAEDFNTTSTTNNWYFIRGACLTASTANAGTSPGPNLPGCTSSSLKSSFYYGENQVGGTLGVAGTAQTLPDLDTLVNGVTTHTGALRFTNGNGTTNNSLGVDYGSNEGGAIISAVPFDATNGVQITFKTVTYRGDGGGGDGADGISFFMIDGGVTPSIGSAGGSLGYSCSNPSNIGGHPTVDGITGAYIGLGIDEYGNFLNGPNDSTATGFGAQGNRIGLRGAGAVSWPYLSITYPQYYPPAVLNTTALQQSAVADTCQKGYISDYTHPSSPVAVTANGSSTVSFNGQITSGSNVITGVPSIPIGLVQGATVTDATRASHLQTGTTITAIGTNTITLSAAATRTTSGDTFTTPSPNVSVADYQAIPGGYSILSGVNIANESAMSRGAATPIYYNLKITANGILNLSYSLSGAAYQPVISNQNIVAYSGAMPATLRFGFAGSTGGATNIHEIMCFKAAPQNTSGSSATVNEKESAKVQTTSQAFFAFYDPNVWTGTVTANLLIDNAGVVTVNPTAIWDAGCLLNGTATGAPAAGGGCVTTGVSGPTSATPVPASRVMLSWDPSSKVGIPFEWSNPLGNLNSNQEANLDALDTTTVNGVVTPTQTATRLSYLRGTRTNEINTSGVGLYRPRTSILGDIVDSSPTWVGPAISPYSVTWADMLPSAASADSMVENSGTQSYSQFVNAELNRLNVVYVGANDGLLHGFEAGTVDSQGNLTNSTTNDGKEVIAYMPGSTLLSAANSTTSANCTGTNHALTQSQVQNIHGVTPAIGSTALCVDPSLDFANPQYGHNFFVDATPGTGDLFYGGVWHTWLVGGLGAGGAAIYALDITNPANFSEANASTLVLGEWNPSTINAIGCSSTPASCGGNLGNTFGTPQIRRLHNGQWGVIFGNGFGSSTGDAGIYVMTISFTGNTLTPSFYYLSTGHAGGNGIAFVTPVDLDGDHITDYVYAGDLKGNIWRFDLTSASPSNWAASPAPGGTTPVPLFTTPTGQPISTQVLAISSTATGSPQKLMIEFATGQRTQLTNAATVSFASGTQAIYGIWDWNMSAWNALSGSQYASLGAVAGTSPGAVTATATGLTSPFTTSTSNLTAQTFTVNTTSSASAGIVEETTTATVCWRGGTACSGGPSANNKFGWYVNLVGGVTTPAGLQEQVIFSPVFFQGAILVDTTVPANNLATSCSANLDAGFTYVLNATNGGIFADAFPTFTPATTGPYANIQPNDPIAAGIQTNATGSVYVVTTAQRTTNVIYQTVSGSPSSQQVNIPANTKSKRLTWVEKR